MDYGRTQTFCLTHFTRLKGIIPNKINQTTDVEKWVLSIDVGKLIINRTHLKKKHYELN